MNLDALPFVIICNVAALVTTLKRPGNQPLTTYFVALIGWSVAFSIIAVVGVWATN